ncbi:MAG TPA: BON domain-containing protein [Nitrospiraceae bacterium]|nr:BON domain-containing protein [Nitrospiraceae bacterium]
MALIPKVVGTLSCVSLMLLGSLNGCIGKGPTRPISDASISVAVQAKLIRDHASHFPRINVDTENGVVNLSGVVKTDVQRAQAEHLASQVDGVVKVNNNLQIQN